ncbi:kinase-like domain-containing protein [Leptodontidium sp. 2 PMI_412]|nr:kinase-like domain-containing protein [Leptodontidium sp. 2 PMI_412]
MAKFPPTAEQIEEGLNAFIDSIDPNVVCKLASQHNSSQICWMFQDPANGSYNVCYFVEFEDGTQWVVRIPLEPSISNVWDKVQSEVATIRYLQAKTTIPVPHIHAFGRGGTVDEENPTGLAYIIQSYIPGQSLDISAFLRTKNLEQRNHFYDQLINFTSAADFACHQYDLLDWKYRLPAYNLSRKVAELEIFGLEDLKRRLSDYVNDDASFVLNHTDLRPSNIIVDEGLCIQGIIDWEWAGTVPRQFFLPPTWLAGLPPDRVSGVEYRVEYRWFRDVLIANTSYHQLASEWDRKLPRRIDLPLAVTLRHHNCFVNIYYRGIFPKFYEDSWEHVVNKFFNRDGKDGQFSLGVQQRLRDSERFTQYLEENRLVSSQRRAASLPGATQDRPVTRFEVLFQFPKLFFPYLQFLFHLLYLIINLYNPFLSLYNLFVDLDNLVLASPPP